MKTNPLAFWLLTVALGLTRTHSTGEEIAVVKDNHVNVRGQASLIGEVITQLQKGEKVVVLEEIAGGKTKKEPAKWARIQMPANTPVWVFASYIDPTHKSVSATRVNLRAGPGENYSVVGRLERGEAVKEIRTVDAWMEIETPDKAYAFVAAEYLEKLQISAASGAAAPPKSEVASEPKRTEPEQTPTPAENVTTAQKPLPESAPALKLETAPPPTQIVPATTDTTKASAPAATEPNTALPPATSPPNTPPPAPTLVLPPQPAAATPTETGPPPKRVVRREGIVRSTKSIQAPTYFELIGADSRKPMNYLHTTDPELKLKDFKGKKIVVTGEEAIDARWPSTPILEIETIELAP